MAIEICLWRRGVFAVHWRKMKNRLQNHLKPGISTRNGIDPVPISVPNADRVSANHGVLNIGSSETVRFPHGTPE